MSWFAAVLLLATACFGFAADARVLREEWSVMDTVAAVQAKGPDDEASLLAARRTVADVFTRIECLLDAHDPQSELSRLASLPDAAVLAQCDPFVRPCYEAAFALRDQTDRLFNPRWRGPGTLDLGAIAKGYAVDKAAEALADLNLAADLLVDLGGNLKSVAGTWTTEVSFPSCRRPRTFDLSSPAACATSGAYFRGAHIRDGRDGSEVVTDVFSVTVVHPSSAMLADGLSTVMFVLGQTRGERFLKKRHPLVRALWSVTEKKE